MLFWSISLDIFSNTEWCNLTGTTAEPNCSTLIDHSEIYLKESKITIFQTPLKVTLFWKSIFNINELLAWTIKS